MSERAAETEQKGNYKYCDCGYECRPYNELTRKSDVAAHFLNHGNTWDRNGCSEDRNESREMSCSKAFAEEEVSNADSESGNDYCAHQNTENYLALELRDRGELKLRAENEKRKRDRHIREIVENSEQRSDI